MNDQQAIDFYNQESQKYSSKRYPEIASSYYQYLFTKRREIFLAFVNAILPKLGGNPSLLEVGCADGIILKSIETRFPNSFTSIVGMDISPKMIETAKANNKNDKISFKLKHELQEGAYDIVVELGVRAPIEDQLSYAQQHLKPGGYFIYSLIGRKSSYANLKLDDASKKLLKSYAAYEETISKYNFAITDLSAYGLFVPKLWKFPTIARVPQSFLDFIFRKITPELFHEQIYVLRKGTGDSSIEK